jgi:hypothetical protein
VRRKSQYQATTQAVLPEVQETKKEEIPERGFTGTMCPVCRYALQYIPNNGVTCPNGHCFAWPIAPGASYMLRDEFDGNKAVPEHIAMPLKVNGAPVPGAYQELLEVPVLHQRVVLPEKMSEKIECVVKFETEDRSSVQSEAHKKQATAAGVLDDLVLADGYDRIVESVFTVDPWAAYETLEKSLKLAGEAHRADYATLITALDACQDNSREAHRLFVSAKVAVARYEADASVLLVDMRKQATAALDEEKASGERKKQITEADVESRIAALFPDEWRALEDRRARAKGMVLHIERLAELWKERCRDLRTMVETSRR